MEEKIKEFDILVEKKAKTTKDNTDKAVKILLNIYKAENNPAFLVKKLISASHVVTSEYGRRYIPSMSKSEINDINTEIIKNLNTPKMQLQSLLPVAFSFAAMGFSRSCHKQEFLPLLKSAIIKCEDKNSFTETKCKIFKDHLLDKCEALVLELDFSEWKEYDRKRLDNFLLATFPTETELNKVLYTKIIVNWRERYNFKTSNTEPQKTLPLPVVPNASKAEQTPEEVKRILGNSSAIKIEKYVSELEKLYNNAFEKNNAFASLENTLLGEKTKLNLANQAISQKNLEIKNLQEKYLVLEKLSSELTAEIEEKSAEILDLNTRLKKAFSVDSITQNQELVSLKNNISNSLKLQYADFGELSMAEMSGDNYQFFKITLRQVFKTLERYGIEFDK